MSQPSASTSRILPLLNQLTTKAASRSNAECTIGDLARALLSDVDRKHLNALSKKPIPPVSAPHRRGSAQTARKAHIGGELQESTLSVLWKYVTPTLPIVELGVLTLSKDHVKPTFLFLAPPQGNVVWLDQNHNKMKLGEVGIEEPVALERFLNGKWEDLGWETRMKVRSGDAILLRAKGVTQLKDWEMTTTHLLI
jgi:hypothetical protein